MIDQNTAYTADKAPVSLVRKPSAPGRQALTLHSHHDLYYLTSPLLDKKPWLCHGFSTRLGGVSAGETATMNLSFPREENKENVRENYRRLAEAIGFDVNTVTMTHQTHTSTVHAVNAAECGAGYAFPRPWQDTDALVTDIPGVTLVCFSADCVPILFADGQHHAIGCAHSGWRGTISDIAGNTVREMTSRFGSDPACITAAIGPSICADCYEVGEEVASLFETGYSHPYETGILRRKENGKYLLGLWEAVRQNLLRAGLRPENISLPDLCTRCNGQLLFSHRRQGGRQGNLGAVISIKYTL